MDTKQKIETHFNQWKNAKDFSGVISVSSKNGVILEKVQGFRNRGERLPNEIDTAFGIASGTKLFTSAAVCQLLDQGKLTLESKIKDILPQDLKAIDSGATVFHLLTHSSGVADYLDFDDEECEIRFYDTYPVNTWTSNEFYLSLFNKRPNKFAPGSKADYSNSNFILLGLIIETVSGVNYHAYIKSNIIDILNMTKTGFYATNNLPANTAIGYIWDKQLEEYVANYFRLPVIGAADGGLYTTAADMRSFWNGVFEKKLFSQSMLTQFLTPRMRFDDIDGSLGLGVFVSKKNGEVVYWHDGGDYGVNFCTAYFPCTGSVLTILSNVGIDILDFQDSLMSLLVLDNS